MSRLSAIELVKCFNGMTAAISKNRDGLSVPMLGMINEIRKVFYKEGVEQLIIKG